MVGEGEEGEEEEGKEGEVHRAPPKVAPKKDEAEERGAPKIGLLINFGNSFEFEKQQERRPPKAVQGGPRHEFQRAAEYVVAPSHIPTTNSEATAVETHGPGPTPLRRDPSACCCPHR